MNWIDYYFLGHTPLLPWLGEKTAGASYTLFLGILLGYLVAKIKLIPEWLHHWGVMLDLLNPDTPGGLGATQDKLEVIERKLDDLTSPRPD